MTTIDKIAWIHLENGKLLCARSKGKSIYYIPGGKREPGESDEQTLVREIEEELSVRIKPVTITHYGTFEAQADGKAEGVRVKISCFTGQYEGTINPASEIEELAWLGYGDIDRVSEASRLIFERLRADGLLN